jgi:hypothetical protein
MTIVLTCKRFVVHIDVPSGHLHAWIRTRLQALLPSLASRFRSFMRSNSTHVFRYALRFV